VDGGGDKSRKLREPKNASVVFSSFHFAVDAQTIANRDENFLRFILTRDWVHSGSLLMALQCCTSDLLEDPIEWQLWGSVTRISSLFQPRQNNGALDEMRKPATVFSEYQREQKRCNDSEGRKILLVLVLLFVMDGE
jgi:hypothetical protein